MTKEKPFKKIIDAITGEETIIELTAEEIAEIQAQDAKIEADRVAAEAAENAKIAAKESILAKLGLTAEEATALLG